MGKTKYQSRVGYIAKNKNASTAPLACNVSPWQVSIKNLSRYSIAVPLRYLFENPADASSSGTALSFHFFMPSFS